MATKFDSPLVKAVKVGNGLVRKSIRQAFPNQFYGEAPLRLEIDQQNLVSNWTYLKSLCPTAQGGAAVKANAYGIGARRVVKALRQAGCRDFFVTYTSEANDIKDLADPSEIALLHGPLTPADAAWAKRTGVRPVINSVRQAQLWLSVGGGRCDVMVDTGINRLGFSMHDLGHECLRRLDIDVLHSHLASADQDSPLNALQLKSWEEAKRAVPWHDRAALANSAGITLGIAYHGELVRPGLAIYGGIPCPALEGGIRQVVRPQAAVMQVRRINPEEGIGYNSTFIAKKPMRIGIIALGYADGYLRCWSGSGRFEWNGIELPVLGRVSMDMTVIDLSAAPGCGEGDWVTAAYELPTASAETDLSQYELLTLLGHRFARP